MYVHMYACIDTGILTSDMENHPFYHVFIHVEMAKSGNTNRKAAINGPSFSISSISTAG